MAPDWLVPKAALMLPCLEILLSGCLPEQDPASYVTGLRVLAIQAQPPEAQPGQSSTLAPLVVDTRGRPLNIDWSLCLVPPFQGEAVNSNCLVADAGGTRRPLGSGLQFTVTMPMAVSAQTLGLPDATGGVYLPLIAQARAGSDTLIASYRLRLGTRAPANQNPMLAGVFTVVAAQDGAADAGSPGAGDTVTALDPAIPLVVHSGDQLTLRALFGSGSAETYQIQDPRGDAGTIMPRTVTETLSLSWFATAGSLSEGTSGAGLPDEILKLDQHLPASGTAIDLWVVGRDERGGTDYLHRTLSFQ